MRVNVYAEEMTRVEVIEKQIDGQTFMGIRFYLELPATGPDGQQHRGPFVHRPGDDDSSAVTFWGKRDLRVVLRKGLEALEAVYGPKGGQPTDAPVAAPVDTLNRFGIGAGSEGDSLVSLFLRRAFSKEEAFNLAAWLVALSGDRERFDQVLAAVLKT